MTKFPFSEFLLSENCMLILGKGGVSEAIQGQNNSAFCYLSLLPFTSQPFLTSVKSRVVERIKDLLLSHEVILEAVLTLLTSLLAVTFSTTAGHAQETGSSC